VGDLGMNLRVKTSLLLLCFAITALWPVSYAAAAAAGDKARAAQFLPEERKIIQKYYRSAGTSNKGLPPGLAKRGKLPPGLQKQVEKNGQLPPGLQKRLEPLPTVLNRQLPNLPDYWERVIVERDVILLDRRTNRVLDIIENVIGLASGE
jgi:hypothetical protein